MPPLAISQLPRLDATTLPLLIPPTDRQQAAVPQTSADQFVSPEEVALRQNRANLFTQQSARAPNPIAAALLGFQGGFGGAKAQRQLADNRALTAQTLDQLRNAPSGSLGSVLLGSPNPQFVLAGVNQRAQEEQRAAAASLGEKKLALEREKLNQAPDVIRTLQAAGIQPGTDAFQDAVVKSLSRGTNIFTGDVSGASGIEAIGNKKFGEEAAKLDAERFSILVDQGSKALRREADLNILSDAVIGAKTSSLAPIRTAFQGLADSFGIDTSELGSLSDAEAIEAVAQRLAPTLRQPGSGAQSDTELRGFLASLPGLSKSVPGNKLIISTLRAMGERSKREAAIASMALAGRRPDGTPYTREQARRDLAAVPPAITPRMFRTMQFLASQGKEIGEKFQGRLAVNPQTGEMRINKGTRNDPNWVPFTPPRR